MSVLNPILSRWMNVEAKAPNVDCARCSMAEFDPGNAKRWRDFKCCTFQPFFPNFYLGAMLEKGIALPLNANTIAQPIGLYASQDFRLKRDAVPDAQRGKAHVCSAYQGGQCSVWEFRPGECSTFYCRGDVKKFGKSTFQIESAVAQMALVYQGFTPRQISEQVEWMEAGRGENQTPPNDLYIKAWAWARELLRVEVESWLE